MNELQEYKELAKKAIEAINAYQEKQTKAQSKRIRAITNQLGKDGVILRKTLLELDKA